MLTVKEALGRLEDMEDEGPLTDDLQISFHYPCVGNREDVLNGVKDKAI